MEVQQTGFSVFSLCKNIPCLIPFTSMNIFSSNCLFIIPAFLPVSIRLSFSYTLPAAAILSSFLQRKGELPPRNISPFPAACFVMNFFSLYDLINLIRPYLFLFLRLQEIIQLRIQDICDKHMSRSMGNYKGQLRILDCRLRSNAASPEYGNLSSRISTLSP